MYEELFKGNKEAEDAYNILWYTPRAVFLTGKAGTGKSTFIKWAELISNSICYKVAPTGIAARNIDGKTINSVFHLPPQLIFSDDDEFFKKQRFKGDDQFQIYWADLIIIDEISMVTSAQLDCIDRTIRNLANPKESFGGKKVLIVGDPFQLTPIINSDDKKVLLKKYKSEYFFDAHVWKKLNPMKIELQNNYRQKETVFYEILNDIRENKNVASAVEKINSLTLDPNYTALEKNSLNGITLTFNNENADEINKKAFDELPGESKTFPANYWGEFNENSCLAERILKLKVGARVMLVKNHPNRVYVNGTLGTVKEIETDKITIKDDNDNIFEVEKTSWENKKYFRIGTKGYETELRVVGYFRQFPIRLAWAITVHKSQGLTFDNVYLLNSGNAFANGQTYVALSRCRSIEGLKLFKRLSTADIFLDNRIKKFFQGVNHDEERKYLIEEIIDNRVLESLPNEFSLNEAKEIAINEGYNTSENWISIWLQRVINNYLVEEIGNGIYKKYEEKKKQDPAEETMLLIDQESSTKTIQPETDPKNVQA